MAHDVFLSYSSKDKAAADAVCHALERNRIRVWMAPRDVMAGMGWAESIIEAINGARVMVLLFSSNANGSPQIAREVERAVHKELRIVPVRIEGVPPSEALEFFISAPHWIDAFPPPLEQHLDRMVSAVERLLEQSNLRRATPQEIEGVRPVEIARRERAAAKASDEVLREVKSTPIQATAARLNPVGFWSYSSSDDTISRGRLSQLRKLLADELQGHIGRTPKVKIFQDVVAIPPGTEWDTQIRASIEKASFMIPIVSPGFLQSKEACREIALFRQREQRLGRNDLIFPIYYIGPDDLDDFDGEVVHDRATLDFLRTRQWKDFRKFRHKDPEGEEISVFLEKLASSIRDALRQPR